MDPETIPGQQAWDFTDGQGDGTALDMNIDFWAGEIEGWSIGVQSG
jgi:hypothetical protein